MPQVYKFTRDELAQIAIKLKLLSKTIAKKLKIRELGNLILEFIKEYNEASKCFGNEVTKKKLIDIAVSMGISRKDAKGYSNNKLCSLIKKGIVPSRIPSKIKNNRGAESFCFKNQTMTKKQLVELASLIGFKKTAANKLKKEELCALILKEAGNFDEVLDDPELKTLNKEKIEKRKKAKLRFKHNRSLIPIIDIPAFYRDRQPPSPNLPESSDESVAELKIDELDDNPSNLPEYFDELVAPSESKIDELEDYNPSNLLEYFDEAPFIEEENSSSDESYDDDDEEEAPFIDEDYNPHYE